MPEKSDQSEQRGADDQHQRAADLPYQLRILREHERSDQGNDEADGDVRNRHIETSESATAAHRCDAMARRRKGSSGWHGRLIRSGLLVRSRLLISRGLLVRLRLALPTIRRGRARVKRRLTLGVGLLLPSGLGRRPGPRRLGRFPLRCGTPRCGSHGSTGGTPYALALHSWTKGKFFPA